RAEVSVVAEGLDGRVTEGDDRDRHRGPVGGARRSTEESDLLGDITERHVHGHPGVGPLDSVRRAELACHPAENWRMGSLHGLWVRPDWLEVVEVAVELRFLVAPQ